MTRSRPAPRLPRRASTALLLVFLTVGSLPIAPAALAVPPPRPALLHDVNAAPPANPTASGTYGVPTSRHPAADTRAALDTRASGAGEPSIVYQEAMAHANDRIDFTPGGRVQQGFSPRAGDGWPVDGKAPGTLPSGRATGRDMARSRQGSAWAPLDPANGQDGTGPTDPASAAPSASPDDPDDSTAPAPDAASTPVDAPIGDSPIPADGASYVMPTTIASDGPAVAAGLRRQVFGFLPYWETSGAASTLNYDVLSTIAYFSVGADKAGNLLKKNSDGTTTTGWGGWTSSSMTSVISAAHARGTRVVLTISVFAWSTGQATTQATLLGSPTARLNLARQAAAAVRDRGADGVNLDFEPLVSGYETEFVSLLQTFRTELNRIHAGYQLTYDTTGYIGNYPIEASVASGAADAIFIMGYDYRTSSATYAGSIDPLSGPAYDLTDTVRAFTARVAPSKVILGLPWYGRAWSTVSSAANAKNQSGTKFGASTAVNYASVVDLVAKYGRRWDSREQTPWIAYQRQNCTATYGCVTSWREIYYDDATSMKLRYAVVNQYGLRGAGLWALGYDGGHAELYKALSDSFLVDRSGPQAGITMLPATQGDEGFVVTWSATDVSAIASYDVQASTDGGPWTAWLTGTTATSDVWLGRDGHGYAFRGRAKDAKGNLGSWNVTATWTASPTLAVGGFGRVRIDGLSYRAGPDTTAQKLGAVDTGTIVAMTGGPVVADGYTWWEVTQPIREWGPVSFVERGVWIAGSNATSTFVGAYRAPNATTVDAGLHDFGFGFGTSAESIGSTPAARAARAFSPNGDGSEDALRVRWTSIAALDGLTLNTFRTDGTAIGANAVSGLGAGAHTWDWDGRVGGSTLPDGRYVVQLVGTAGGATYRAPSSRPVTPVQLAAFGITIDTVPPNILSAAAATSLISPNGDGIRETAAFSLSAGGGATHWQLRIRDAAGVTVRTISGSGAAASTSWNGRTDTGAIVPDGAYQASLVALDDAANSATRNFSVRVDTTAPLVASAATPASFSPNGDGATDRTTLRWTSTESAAGVASIYRGTTLVRKWAITARSSWAMAWDGRTAAGPSLPDGRYRYRVDVRDAGGNRTIVYATVTIDRSAGYLSWSRSFYPQDGDALTPTSVVSFKLVRQATTTLRILDTNGALVRTVWANRVLAAGTRTWTWNGRTAAGTYVVPGRYVAELTAMTTLGSTRLVRALTVDAFAATASATTVRVGQTLTVTFQSVEPLSTRPTATFTQPGRTAIRVTATRLSNGSYRASFRIQAGAAGPATLRIAARDSSGRINATLVTITVAS
jgi:spore germination protein YaaH/flagellar hook assembly protein FlgD